MRCGCRDIKRDWLLLVAHIKELLARDETAMTLWASQPGLAIFERLLTDRAEQRQTESISIRAFVRIDQSITWYFYSWANFFDELINNCETWQFALATKVQAIIDNLPVKLSAKVHRKYHCFWVHDVA